MDSKQGAQSNNAVNEDTRLKVDLKKLKRVDLLELLLEQARDNEQKTAAVSELSDRAESLQSRLNEADARVARLEKEVSTAQAENAKLRAENKLLKDSLDMLDVRDLVEFQEYALMEYLKMKAVKRKK